MELIRNLLKYLLILLTIAFVVCGLMAGILFFFPNVQLFGIRFASFKDDYVSLVTEATVTKLNVETHAYNINIVPNLDKNATNNNLRIVIENNYTGYSTNGVTVVQFLDVSQNEETYVDIKSFDTVNLSKFKIGSEYTIKLKEPTGILGLANSNVTIYVPENASGVEYNLKTNKGKISFLKNPINSSKMLSTSDIDISVNSNRGSFDLSNVNMLDGKTLTISNYLGRVDVNTEKISNVNIQSNSGNFTFKNIGYENGEGGNLTVTGNNPYIKANTVYGNVNYEATTGFVEINKIVKDADITTENGIIRIDTILGGVYTNNNSGETTIKQIGEEGESAKSADIKTKSGAINLGDEDKVIHYLNNVISENGKIQIKNLNAGLTNIQTNSGLVDVNFSSNQNKKGLIVTSTSGQINLSNIFGDITAKTGKGGKIIAQLNSISALSSFETDGGNIELTMPVPTNNENKKYTLNLLNKSNKLDITIGEYRKNSFDGDKNANGYFELTKTFPEGISTVNTVNVKTNSGKIVIKEK